MTFADGYTDISPGKIAAVVTSLEMTARPPRKADPLPDAWTLRRVEAPEPEWYRDLFRRVGQDWLWFSRLRMSDDALRAIIHDPLVEVYALSVEGIDGGLVELDFRQSGECELAYFGVAPDLVGRGAGRWLMNRAIERAWSRLIRRFWVHTCTVDHPGALGFYLRSGFRAYRRQIEIADDPRLTGDLPRDAAPHVPMIEA